MTYEIETFEEVPEKPPKVDESSETVLYSPAQGKEQSTENEYESNYFAQIKALEEEIRILKAEQRNCNILKQELKYLREEFIQNIQSCIFERDIAIVAYEIGLLQGKFENIFCRYCLKEGEKDEY